MSFDRSDIAVVVMIVFLALGIYADFHADRLSEQQITVLEKCVDIMKRELGEKPKVIYVKKYIVVPSSSSVPVEVVETENPLQANVDQLSRDLAVAQAELKRTTEVITIISKQPRVRKKAVMIGIDTDGLILGHSWKIFDYTNLGIQIDNRAHPGAFLTFDY